MQSCAENIRRENQEINVQRWPPPGSQANNVRTRVLELTVNPDQHRDAEHLSTQKYIRNICVKFILLTSSLLQSISRHKW